MPANIKKSLTVMIKMYGGNGVVNTRVKAAKKAECDEREYSITLKLPALGVAVFTWALRKKFEKNACCRAQPDQEIHHQDKNCTKGCRENKSGCKKPQ